MGAENRYRYSRYATRRSHSECCPKSGQRCSANLRLPHVVCFHDDWCGIYAGKGCNCEPGVLRGAEAVLIYHHRAEMIPHFLDRITDVLGVPSFGKS